MNGLIFNIKRYAIHDGPGIRVTFFLKGCPLSCCWCHNPEGISPLPQEAERIDRLGEREFRVNEIVGREYSVDEIVKEAMKERVFMEESGGGVTFSGGEPLMQRQFLLEALVQLREIGMHTAVDTSGYSNRENFRSIADVTDLFLFDIKHLDPDRHRELTGVSNRNILANFNYLMDRGRPCFLRIPVIPGYNDDDMHIGQLFDFISRYRGSSLEEINLLPYHITGSSKYGRFSMKNRMAGAVQPSDERMDNIKTLLSRSGIRVKIGG